MLEIRPNCEFCDQDLPADSTQAYICTYECTFCETCVNQVLQNVCPNCGGGFSPRPIRPKLAYRPGVSAAHQIPSSKRVHTQYSKNEISSFSEKLKDIPKEER